MASVPKLESVSGERTMLACADSGNVPILASVAASNVALSAPDGPVTDAPVAITVTVPKLMVDCALKASLATLLKVAAESAIEALARSRQGSSSRDCPAPA